MFPAVPLPEGLAHRAVDFRLKPGWRYDEAKSVFVDSDGEQFAPVRLPKEARIVYKVPDLARANARGLTRAERDLQRYMQVILPPGMLGRCVKTVGSWPCVEEAHAAPEVSLPALQPPGTRTARRRRRRS